jgi:hypothetical protein
MGIKSFLWIPFGLASRPVTAPIAEDTGLEDGRFSPASQPPEIR